MSNVCCTCASIVTSDVAYDIVTEKVAPNKRLDCCGRLVCRECIKRNPRFGTYCTFCQTPGQAASAASSSAEAPPLPPPSYSDHLRSIHTPPPAPQPHHASLAYPPDEPPPYDEEDGNRTVVEEKHPDVIHHLSPNDSMTSLSLAYRVPVGVLRQYNNLWSDHLLSARKMVLIPGQYYQGPSLAPDPVEDEEETERKAKIRRLMTRCKIHEYDLAVLYLEQANWRFEDAAEKYEDDERWEREHPLKGKQKAAEVRRIGRRLATRA